MPPWDSFQQKQLKLDPAISTFHQPAILEHIKFDMPNDVLKKYAQMKREE